MTWNNPFGKSLKAADTEDDKMTVVFIATNNPTDIIECLISAAKAVAQAQMDGLPFSDRVLLKRDISDGEIPTIVTVYPKEESFFTDD